MDTSNTIQVEGDGLRKKAKDFIEKEKQMIHDKYEEQKAAGPFTTEKLVSVAIVGAFAGLLTYYIYYSLPSETRTTLYSKVKTSAKKYVSEVVPAMVQEKMST